MFETLALLRGTRESRRSVRDAKVEEKWGRSGLISVLGVFIGAPGFRDCGEIRAVRFGFDGGKGLGVVVWAGRRLGGDGGCFRCSLAHGVQGFGHF